jgi:hypothetical protein
MRVNKYFIFALIYFFFNSLGLPLGLTYTAILSPLLYWWVVVTRRKEVLLPFFLVLFPFLAAQLLWGVTDKTSFFISSVYLVTVYIFCQAVYTFLKNCNDVESIFSRLLRINLVFCLIAIPLYFTPFNDILWIDQFLTQGVNNFRRLKLFTYEASYYATLFTPLFFFYFLKVIRGENRGNTWLLLFALILPLALSFSLGVISTIIIATFLAVGLHLRTIFRIPRARNLVGWSMITFITALVFLLIFFPDNTLFLRINNILAGNDLSGQGRTSDSFLLAGRILDLKNPIWGIGPGQTKVIGSRIIKEYYNYPVDYNIIAIPNATAETWTVFGWAGLILRLTIEIGLFYYTRVWRNTYRLALFLFIFLYQFTGSFITNLAEYVIWILAFTNLFPEFDLTKRNEPKIISDDKERIA